MNKVILSNGVEFNNAEGKTILDSAKIENIVLEHSCRNGRCGSCGATVVTGETKKVMEEEALSTEDLKSGKILTCCRTTVSDVRLNIEDLGLIGNLPLLTLPCRIDNIKRLNENVIELLLRLPPGSCFSYFAGQYLELIHNGFRRCYSIANALRSDNKIELHVKRVHDGKMSDYLFLQAASEDLLRLEGPRGTFSYRDNESQNIVMMATGTGIAPIKAMLESFTMSGVEKKIYVFWGGRFSSDLYFDTRELDVKHTFIPVLSRERRKGAFNGYVQDAVLDMDFDLNDTTVYACGSEEMIRDAKKVLVANGLSDKLFYSDAFVSSN